MRDIKQSSKVTYILALQHVLAMFGATVLVPQLTGMNSTVAIFTAGAGTLLFHFFTGGIVPVFLGSSFAFIGAITVIYNSYGIAATKFGIIAAGLVYLVISLIVKIYGVDKLKSYFPPIVTGPVIMLIGIRLSSVALDMIGYDFSSKKFDLINLLIATIVVITMIMVTIIAKSFFKLVPILIAVTIGYLISIIVDFFFNSHLVNLQNIVNAPWLSIQDKSVYETIRILPQFNLDAVFAIAPISIIVFMEHIGDITTNGAVVGKNFFKNPGIHRTILGDGMATIFAGILGGPANTTYGENTGVLAVTKVYDPKILRIAAIYAIILSFIGKFGAIVSNIPVPVMGGVSLILFGMIASIGVRTLIEARPDFSNSRNLIIASLIFVVGIGIEEVIIFNNLSMSGLAIAAFIGVILNKILPSNI